MRLPPKGVMIYYFGQAFLQYSSDILDTILNEVLDSAHVRFIYALDFEKAFDMS